MSLTSPPAASFTQGLGEKEDPSEAPPCRWTRGPTPAPAGDLPGSHGSGGHGRALVHCSHSLGFTSVLCVWASPHGFTLTTSPRGLCAVPGRLPQAAGSAEGRGGTQGLPRERSGSVQQAWAWVCQQQCQPRSARRSGTGGRGLAQDTTAEGWAWPCPNTHPL